MSALEAVVVVLAGVLAGEELAVRWGLQPALDALGDRAHLEARQALIRRLRVLVPAVMLPTVALSLLVLVLDRPVSVWWLGGTGGLVAFVLASFLGTVPINIRVNDWDPAAPPADWRAVVSRWERVDVLRSSAAVAGFVLLLISVVRG